MGLSPTPTTRPLFWARTSVVRLLPVSAANGSHLPLLWRMSPAHGSPLLWRWGGSGGGGGFSLRPGAAHSQWLSDVRPPPCLQSEQLCDAVLAPELPLGSGRGGAQLNPLPG